MEKFTKKILITGGSGFLGRSIRSLIPQDILAYSTRDELLQNRDDVIFIDDSGFVKSSKLESISTIINCVGTNKGNKTNLIKANLSYPKNLAYRAKIAGVERFIQVSSFSVFGNSEYIDINTPVSPSSLYGLMKAKAEEEVLSLADSSFSVFCLRLPFMFDREKPSLLGMLIGVARALRALPALRTEPQIERSMMSYRDAAYCLLKLVSERDTGIASAADPTPFCVERLIALMNNFEQKRYKVIPVPKMLASGLSIFVPQIASRLFRSSVLLPQANWARYLDLPVGIDREIESILESSRRNWA